MHASASCFEELFYLSGIHTTGLAAEAMQPAASRVFRSMPLFFGAAASRGDAFSHFAGSGSSPAAAFSTQREEQTWVPNPTQSQATSTPPVLGNVTSGDQNSPGGAHYDVGSSSQTVATQLAGEDMKKLVHNIFEVYECRSLERQCELIRELYEEGAVYENNVTLLQDRDSIMRRFALLPMTTGHVKVEYEAPTVLGATTSGPEALDNLATKGDLQIEVNNTQAYSFDRAHSMWRYIFLPTGDLKLPVLTRLTLNKDASKVLYHRDMWTHTQEWWRPLQRCWGAVEKVAASTAAAAAAGTEPRQHV